jgi:iron-sulfur cluster repair protein YtfE (RIC family)
VLTLLLKDGVKVSEIEEILNRVEELRVKLNKLAEDKNGKFTDPKIVSISRELDFLLNTYHKAMMAKIENYKIK